MPITTIPSERIGRCTRMRRFFVRFNRSESFAHTRSSAGFTIITSGFEFSVHTQPKSSWDERKDFSDWHANVTSCGRALLMLFLFSDVGECDAPTRIKSGSHLDMARFLKPSGEAGMSHAMLDELAAAIDRPEALAIGEAGTVYLCHPFLAHAAQMHRGSVPRFLAQPPLHAAEPFQLNRMNNDYSRWRWLSDKLYRNAKAKIHGCFPDGRMPSGKPTMRRAAYKYRHAAFERLFLACAV
jgi:hypothetical protein